MLPGCPVEPTAPGFEKQDSPTPTTTTTTMTASPGETDAKPLRVEISGAIYVTSPRNAPFGVPGET